MQYKYSTVQYSAVQYSTFPQFLGREIHSPSRRKRSRKRRLRYASVGFVVEAQGAAVVEVRAQLRGKPLHRTYSIAQKHEAVQEGAAEPASQRL